MFGFKLISEDELIDLRLGKLHAELKLDSIEKYHEEVCRENRQRSLAIMCYNEYISQLEEALEQQTREKEELQKQFDGYRALEFLNR